MRVAQTGGRSLARSPRYDAPRLVMLGRPAKEAKARGDGPHFPVFPDTATQRSPRSVRRAGIGDRKGKGQPQDGLWVIQKVPEELTKLTHPVAHRLRVHEQVVSDHLAAPVVQQPRAQCLLKSAPYRRLDVRQGCQRGGPEVTKSLCVRAQDQLDQPLVGVNRLT